MWGSRASVAPATRAALAGTWLAAYLIALGPTLHAGDEQVRLPVPGVVASLAERALRTDPELAPVLGGGFAEGVPVLLPSAFMYKFLPYARNMRVMARFSVWCALMTAALAGFGLLRVMTRVEASRGPHGARLAAAAVIGLVAFESLSVQPMMPVSSRAVDDWLARYPDGDVPVVIVELPVDQALRSYQNYWATRHQRNTLFGWNGDSFPPPVQAERAAALRDFPSSASVDYLRLTGVTHVLLTPFAIPNWDTMEPALHNSPVLQLEHTIEGVRVYRLRR